MLNSTDIQTILRKTRASLRRATDLIRSRFRKVAARRWLGDVGRFLRFSLCLLPATVLPGGFLTGCTHLNGTKTIHTRGGWHECAQAGQGSPVVVFEAGAGDNMGTWDGVYREIANDTAVFAYSRRGQGNSSPALWGRDGQAVVEQLRGLLAARGLRPPYVLVGHSLGGLYMQLFAKRHPEEVAGVVLVDPTTADHHGRMREELPGPFRVVQAVSALSAFGSLGAELRAMKQNSLLWHAAGPLPACPAIVLTATRPAPPGGQGLTEFNVRMQRELTAAWPGAEQRFVPSGHFIHREQPEEVILAIRDVLARLRPPPEPGA